MRKPGGGVVVGKRKKGEGELKNAKSALELACTQSPYGAMKINAEGVAGDMKYDSPRSEFIQTAPSLPWPSIGGPRDNLFHTSFERSRKKTLRQG